MSFENLTQDHTIEVYYRAQKLYIVSKAGEGGTISPYGNVAVEYNGSVEFTVTPYEGYNFDYLLIDGVKIEIIGNSYVFTEVRERRTIEAVF